MLDAETETVFVGLVFLFLRELRVGEGRGQVAQLRFAQLGHRGAFGGTGGIACRGRQVGVLHGVLDVGVHHVADFVADDGHQFVVVHQVHQGAEDADRAVAACERIHVDHQVDLEVQRQPLGVGNALGEALEADHILVVVLSHGVVGIHPLHRFAAQAGDVRIAERDGRGGVRRGVEQFAGVDLPASDLELCVGRTGTYDAQQYGRDKNEFGFHRIRVFMQGFSGCKFNANCGRLSARCRLFSSAAPYRHDPVRRTDVSHRGASVRSAVVAAPVGSRGFPRATRCLPPVAAGPVAGTALRPRPHSGRNQASAAGGAAPAKSRIAAAAAAGSSRNPMCPERSSHTTRAWGCAAAIASARSAGM